MLLNVQFCLAMCNILLAHPNKQNVGKVSNSVWLLPHLESGQGLWRSGCFEAGACPVQLLHESNKRGMDSIKHCTLLWQLLSNVLTADENVLEVHPVALDLACAKNPCRSQTDENVVQTHYVKMDMVCVGNDHVGLGESLIKTIAST